MIDLFEDSTNPTPDSKVILSDEQEAFIKLALTGKNILVDACIGSGKTTAIQFLCDRIPDGKKVLYLTYNRLLKCDAQKKIQNKNTFVTNYHGFAYQMLSQAGFSCAVQQLIQDFLKYRPSIPHFDVMILDEYQDIDYEIALLLESIRENNPNLQIIAVGDMEQKIYDTTTLNLCAFIPQLLGDYKRLYFTKCFRLSAEHAAMLGRVWKKKIIGVNESCQVEKMTPAEVFDFLKYQNPRDILCLGCRHGLMARILNRLEVENPEYYNKNTIYASIANEDRMEGRLNLDEVGIFTTYDSSKGLERKICVVFDYSYTYWQTRLLNPLQRYTILRNIFCVAASRGKERIIFVTNEPLITEEQLLTYTNEFPVSGMLSIEDALEFKYSESIEECFSFLQVKEIRPFKSENDLLIPNKDGLIDLSPCISRYLKAVFFEKYDDSTILPFLEILNKLPKKFAEKELITLSPEEQVLRIVAATTSQDRYRTQVHIPFISDENKEKLCARLSTVFSSNESCNIKCILPFGDAPDSSEGFCISGFADVYKDNIVYQVKYANSLSHEQFLECALYMVCMKLDTGRLWNVKYDEMYEISITDKREFLNAIARAVTKNQVTKRFIPDISKKDFIQKCIAKNSSRISNFMANMDTPSVSANPEPQLKGTPDESEDLIFYDNITKNKLKNLLSRPTFLVVDTETNYLKRLISVGIVLASIDTLEPIGYKYFVINPHYKDPSMFASSLSLPEVEKYCECTRENLLDMLFALQEKYDIKGVFAYNASFDYQFLPELHSLPWYDIMKIAANKNTNKKIPSSADCFSTGKLKKYSAETIYQLLSNDLSYTEKHNALLDALCELDIMRLIGLPIEAYDCAEYKKKAMSGQCSL